MLSKNYIFHYRSGTSPVTIVYTISKDQNKIFWDAAFCSGVDEFSKKRGREIAIGRLKKRILLDKVLFLDLNTDINVRKIKYDIVDVLMTHPDCPKSFKK